jgi:hypothetical protein
VTKVRIEKTISIEKSFVLGVSDKKCTDIFERMMPNIVGNI